MLVITVFTNIPVSTCGFRLLATGSRHLLQSVACSPQPFQGGHERDGSPKALLFRAQSRKKPSTLQVEPYTKCRRNSFINTKNPSPKSYQFEERVLYTNVTTRNQRSRLHVPTHCRVDLNECLLAFHMYSAEGVYENYSAFGSCDVG